MMQTSFFVENISTIHKRNYWHGFWRFEKNQLVRFWPPPGALCTAHPLYEEIGHGHPMLHVWDWWRIYLSGVVQKHQNSCSEYNTRDSITCWQCYCILLLWARSRNSLKIGTADAQCWRACRYITDVRYCICAVDISVQPAIITLGKAAVCNDENSWRIVATGALNTAFF